MWCVDSNEGRGACILDLGPMTTEIGVGCGPELERVCGALKSVVDVEVANILDGTANVVA